MLSSFFTSKADILIWCHHCMLILSANLFIDLIAQVEKFVHIFRTMFGQFKNLNPCIVGFFRNLNLEK